VHSSECVRRLLEFPDPNALSQRFDPGDYDLEEGAHGAAGPSNLADGEAKQSVGGSKIRLPRKPREKGRRCRTFV